VVGHVEWVTFARVERLPRPGEILHPTETWEEPAGGGGVSVVQLLKLAGEATLYTALGDDDVGHRAKRELERLGVRVEAAFRDAPQRRAFTFIDGNGERTITTIGERHAPSREDPLAWKELADTDAVYITAGDRGALQAARAARVVVATSRIIDAVADAGIEVDALVGSSVDPNEEFHAIHPPPRLVVRTAGKEGGTYTTADGASGRYEPAPLPGPLSDTYGAGDSFAGGLTYALGAGMDLREALDLAARCGAASMTGRWSFEGQTALP
jgi:ribokinase